MSPDDLRAATIVKAASSALRPWIDKLPTRPAVEEYRAFLNAALRDPSMVGAVTPTSPQVAATMAQVVPTTGKPVVVELGAGTGSMSGIIRDRLPTGSRHVAIELSEPMVEHLRAHKPWLEVIHGDAADLSSLLDQAGITQADAVISSIPWSLLPAETQANILEQITDVLAPCGAFTAVSYLHVALWTARAQRFRRRLDSTFDEVITSTTWRNAPPAMNFICRRPLKAAQVR